MGSGGRDTELSPERKSTRELESEIAWFSEQTKKRHTLEKRPETEDAYRWSRKPVEKIRRRYRRYLEELGRRCSL